MAELRISGDKSSSCYNYQSVGLLLPFNLYGGKWRYNDTVTMRRHNASVGIVQEFLIRFNYFDRMTEPKE
jgi:hypothetical protein